MGVIYSNSLRGEDIDLNDITCVSLTATGAVQGATVTGTTSMTTPALAASATALALQTDAAQNITMFASAGAGENPSLIMSGYNTAGSDIETASLTMGDTNDEFVVAAADSANHEGVTVLIPEANQKFRVRGASSAERFSVNEDGTVAIASNNADGIVFGSLGTAVMGIDMSLSGLSGTDYWFYNSSTNYWRADGILKCSEKVEAPSVFAPGSSNLQIKADQGYNVMQRLQSIQSFLVGDYTAVGSLADCTSNGTTTIAKSSTWGFTPTTGDLLHIQDTATSGDEGFYRVVTVNLNTSIIVDRALTGSLSDVDITIYKDVIGFFDTDGTNGQHLVGFSHQDKPLVIGGDRAGTGVGTVPATGHSLGGEDIMIGGKLEVDGASYFDEDSMLIDDKQWIFGTGSDASVQYDENGDDTWQFSLPAGGLSMRTAAADTDNAGLIKVAKVSIAASALTAAAATDNSNLVSQPAGSVLLSAKFVLDTQFSGGSVSDVDVTVGLSGDENGLIAAAAHNLYSDTVGTEYTTRGAYWSATTAAGYHAATATQWIAYFTAVGDTWDNITGGQITGYFMYVDFQGT